MFDITMDNLGDYCKFFVLQGSPTIIKFSTLSTKDIISLDKGFYIPNLVDVNLEGNIFEKCLMLMSFGLEYFIDGFFQHSIRQGIIEETNYKRKNDSVGYATYHTTKFIVHDINRPDFTKLKLKE